MLQTNLTVNLDEGTSVSRIAYAAKKGLFQGWCTELQSVPMDIRGTAIS